MVIHRFYLCSNSRHPVRSTRKILVALKILGTKKKGPPSEDDEPSFGRRDSETGLDRVQVTVSFSTRNLRAEAP